jgi:hypothetical protein
MGAGEEAPPRVPTSAKPAPSPAPALTATPLLRGKVNTLNVLSLVLEVTSRPRVGQTAMPTPSPHMVFRAGTGTRASKWMGGGEQLACAKCLQGVRQGNEQHLREYLPRAPRDSLEQQQRCHKPPTHHFGGLNVQHTQRTPETPHSELTHTLRRLHLLAFVSTMRLQLQIQ